MYDVLKNPKPQFKEPKEGRIMHARRDYAMAK